MVMDTAAPDPLWGCKYIVYDSSVFGCMLEEVCDILI